MIPIKSSSTVLDAINGSVQVSIGGGTIGVLIERDQFGHGVLMSVAQAMALSDALVRATLETAP
jgi:hypothetical protein